MENTYYIKNVMQRLAGFQGEITALAKFFEFANQENYDLVANEDEDIDFFNNLIRSLEIIDDINNDNFIIAVLIFLERKYIRINGIEQAKIKLAIHLIKQIIRRLKRIDEQQDTLYLSINQERYKYFGQNRFAEDYRLSEHGELIILLSIFSDEIKIINRTINLLREYLDEGIIKIIGDEFIKLEEIQKRKFLLNSFNPRDSLARNNQIVELNSEDKKFFKELITRDLNSRTKQN